MRLGAFNMNVLTVCVVSWWLFCECEHSRCEIAGSSPNVRHAIKRIYASCCMCIVNVHSVWSLFRSLSVSVSVFFCDFFVYAPRSPHIISAHLENPIQTQFTMLSDKYTNRLCMCVFVVDAREKENTHRTPSTQLFFLLLSIVAYFFEFYFAFACVYATRFV